MIRGIHRWHLGIIDAQIAQLIIQQDKIASELEEAQVRRQEVMGELLHMRHGDGP